MKQKKKTSKTRAIIITVIVLIAISVLGYSADNESDTNTTLSTTMSTVLDTTKIQTTNAKTTKKTVEKTTTTSSSAKLTTTYSIGKIPSYSGKPYVEINNNKPQFTSSEITNKSFESYGYLDELGRCTVATACVGKDIMPTQKRGEIGQVKPTGWHLVKYDCVDGKYLYNRCHLIGYQLTGENANEKNLVTGTRYLNIDGMLPFENLVTDYVKSTNKHVMYRVTPIFKGLNLLCDGVQMEGYSVEDKGKSISYNVFCYNVQPNIKIDYATGESKGTYSETTTKNANTSSSTVKYCLNTSSKKIHKPNCKCCKQIKSENKEYYKGDKKDLIKQGYTPCKICNP